MLLRRSPRFMLGCTLLALAALSSPTATAAFAHSTHAPALAVRALALRVEPANTHPSWRMNTPMLTRLTSGERVHVVLYVMFTGLSAPLHVHVHFGIQGGGASVVNATVPFTIPVRRQGTWWFSLPWRAGSQSSYTFVGRVRAGGMGGQSTLTLPVNGA